MRGSEVCCNHDKDERGFYKFINSEDKDFETLEEYGQINDLLTERKMSSFKGEAKSSPPFYRLKRLVVPRVIIKKHTQVITQHYKPKSFMKKLFNFFVHKILRQKSK